MAHSRSIVFLFFLLLPLSLLRLFLFCVSYALPPSSLSIPPLLHPQASSSSSSLLHFNLTRNSNPIHSAAHCQGRWIYIYNLSETFNLALLQKCKEIKRGEDLCLYMENSGMGRAAEDGIDLQEGLSVSGNQHNPWFNTWQFSLEIYFHERLKRHSCRTWVAEDAVAFYVPYYAGMDLAYRISHCLPRELRSDELLQWLKRTPTWRRQGGRDHFITLGRIARDFRMPHRSRWGSQMLQHQEWRSMIKLTIERDGSKRAITDTEIAIPYPTYFHPLLRTQARALTGWLLLSEQRFSIASMAGRKRLRTAAFRRHLFDQCERDHRCSLLVCVQPQTSQSIVSLPMQPKTLNNSCSGPSLLQFFHQSEFCLQPSGDSPSRRSYFDAMLAGCIPVIFDRNSAWTQYTSHLPLNGSSYSIYIPPSDLRTRSVFDILERVPKSEIKSKREKIAELLPMILYADIAVQNFTANVVDPKLSEDFMNDGDAFERAITAVLMKIKLKTK